MDKPLVGRSGRLIFGPIDRHHFDLERRLEAQLARRERRNIAEHPLVHVKLHWTTVLGYTFAALLVVLWVVLLTLATH